jgi:hypothetical protein
MLHFLIYFHKRRIMVIVYGAFGVVVAPPAPALGVVLEPLPVLGVVLEPLPVLGVVLEPLPVPPVLELLPVLGVVLLEPVLPEPLLPELVLPVSVLPLPVLVLSEPVLLLLPVLVPLPVLVDLSAAVPQPLIAKPKARTITVDKNFLFILFSPPCCWFLISYLLGSFFPLVSSFVPPPLSSFCFVLHFKYKHSFLKKPEALLNNN